MTEQIQMEDGSELSLLDHLREAHRKGTRGFTEEYLRGLHRTLHQRDREDDELAHAHPAGEEAEETEPAGEAGQAGRGRTR